MKDEGLGMKRQLYLYSLVLGFPRVILTEFDI